MLKYLVLCVTICPGIVFSMQPICMRPVSEKFQMFCKFLEEDTFQEALAQNKAAAKEFTIEEKIALNFSDEEFAKLNDTWMRSSLRIIRLKYSTQEKTNT